MESSSSSSSSSSTEKKQQAKREGRQTFSMLKPLCTQLLDASSTSPAERAALLNSLCRALSRAPAVGLQKCMDYAMFPLLLLLDAAVASRSSSGASIRGGLPTGWANNKMMHIGDKVAESVLSCLEIIFQRCVMETTDQAIVLLRKLTSAAMLSPSEAAEEFRRGVLRCLRAFLENLRPCGTATCVCKLAFYSSSFEELKQNPVIFFTRGKTHQEVVLFEDHTTGPEGEDVACPLGNMQTESMAPVVGHLISLLLQIAEGEAARGAIGSGKLRQDALFTLRVLISKIGSADGVAFFLPGVVSGFSKVMRSSRASGKSSLSYANLPTSGAARWPAAVEEAIKGITEILVIALGDENNPEVCSSENSLDSGGVSDKGEGHGSAAIALGTLQSRINRIAKHGSSGDNQLISAQNDMTNNSGSRLEMISSGEEQQLMETTASVNRATKGETSLPLRTPRTKVWLDGTALHVNQLLMQSFPSLCAHHSPSIRLAVAKAAAILLARCRSSLKACTTLFLECLLLLACDDWEYVASASQIYLNFLMAPPSVTVPDNFSPDEPKAFHNALISILSRIEDQLPKLALSPDISLFVLHGKKLAAAMYFLGPDGVCAHLLDSLMAKQKFIQTMSQCLSFNTAFTGSLERIISKKPASLYGPVVSEVASTDQKQGDNSDKSGEQNVGGSTSTSMHADRSSSSIQAEKLPTAPPWLSVGSGNNLYHVLAKVLRLAGLSAVTDQSRGASLVSLMELLLVNVRLAALNEASYGNASAVGEREGIASGQEQRMAATSVCVLNEIMYGASGAWNEKLFADFGDQMLRRDLPGQGVKGPGWKIDDQGGQSSESESERFTGLLSLQSRWQAAKKEDVTRIMSECAGSMLNDYLAPEVWDQPTDLASAAAAFATKLPMDDDLRPIHSFQDNIMLQKVLVEGVGILGVALGKEFEDGGFLGIALFPLLEKLACRNYDICNATAMSLNTLCSQCQYASVRDLVVANVDLVIDSICRQFRHLATHPNAPNLLAAILRHTDASADLLPLLEEPLRGVVLEVDVLARQNHPQLTVPLLRALREITRATKIEAGVLRSRAADASAASESLFEQQQGIEAGTSSLTESAVEEVITDFVSRRRCRRAVAAIAASCLSACGPLLASKDPQPCLLALDTLEDGIVTLSEAEKALVHESKEMKHIEDLCSAIGFFEASDSLTRPSAANAESESKKLLPSMNRVWPHLVLCLRHHHTSVVMQTLVVIASVTVECGGTFFTRRFQKDAVPILVKLIREGSISLPRKMTRRSPGLLLPSSNGDVQKEETTAPAAALKVQEAVLKAISTIAAHEESASALEGSSFGLIVAWVVITACRVDALKEAATKAVLALFKMDPDLVWILVVDLIHDRASTPAAIVSVTSRDRDETSLSTFGEAPKGFPSLNHIFPRESPRGGLCAQYALYEGDLSSLNRRTAQYILANLVDAGD